MADHFAAFLFRCTTGTGGISHSQLSDVTKEPSRHSNCHGHPKLTFVALAQALIPIARGVRVAHSGEVHAVARIRDAAETVAEVAHLNSSRRAS